MKMSDNTIVSQITLPLYDGLVHIRRTRNPSAPPATRSGYGFLLVENGNQDICINGESRTLSRGGIAFCSVRDAQYYSAPSQSVIIELLLSESLFRRFDQTSDGKTLPHFMPDPDKNRPAFDIAESWYAHPRKSTDINHGFADLFLGELKLSYGLITPDYKKIIRIFQQFLDYIELNYREDISLDTLSEEFGYTRQYCSKVFNDCAGEHLRPYLNRLRIMRMREEMAASSEARHNIIRTAKSHGFASANTYYRALKDFEEC